MISDFFFLPVTQSKMYSVLYAGTVERYSICDVVFWVHVYVIRLCSSRVIWIPKCD